MNVPTFGRGWKSRKGLLLRHPFSAGNIYLNYAKYIFQRKYTFIYKGSYFMVGKGVIKKWIFQFYHFLILLFYKVREEDDE
jgi:hypothetical protein